VLLKEKEAHQCEKTLKRIQYLIHQREDNLTTLWLEEKYELKIFKNEEFPCRKKDEKMR
jgi:hypothetical protein